jgi:predicted ATPase with chaperone activity
MLAEGAPKETQRLVEKQTFESHHSATLAALVGGGPGQIRAVRPGAVCRTHAECSGG